VQFGIRGLRGLGSWFIVRRRHRPLRPDDIEDVLARLRAHGAELVGEVAQVEHSHRLCCVRGPEGILVALAEPLSKRST
jgi:catechol 2,3-dioxygenase-like lactoylglutathione lyase family enzyme